MITHQLPVYSALFLMHKSFTNIFYQKKSSHQTFSKSSSQNCLSTLSKACSFSFTLNRQTDRQTDIQTHRQHSTQQLTSLIIQKPASDINKSFFYHNKRKKKLQNTTANAALHDKLALQWCVCVHVCKDTFHWRQARAPADSLTTLHAQRNLSTN